MGKLLTIYRHVFCSINKWKPKNYTRSSTMKEYSYIEMKNYCLA